MLRIYGTIIDPTYIVTDPLNDVYTLPSSQCLVSTPFDVYGGVVYSCIHHDDYSKLAPVAIPVYFNFTTIATTLSGITINGVAYGSALSVIRVTCHVRNLYHDW
jgi:hypothetical protein